MTRGRFVLLLVVALAMPLRANASEASIEPKEAGDIARLMRAYRETPSRPSVLLPLYASFVGLQACDGIVTMAGISQGAVEGNPIVATAARNPALFWTLKGSTTFLSIYLSERLWRQHHRGQAIAVMIVSNGILAAVAARNASVLRSR